MTATSTLTDTARRELALVDVYGSPDVHVRRGVDTCYFPWVAGLEIMPLRMETRSGTFVLGLRAAEEAVLGKHRHRGTVTAVTLAGEWNYFEYPWVAGPGDWVVENPGTIHTLRMGAGAEVVFTVTGSIEFLADDDSLNFVFDLFTLADLYVQDCAASGRTINTALFH
ncbi:MAG: 2,4'-dihydroxyacetophenone dioxygenase family protein [Sporichthyaceae bacterium]